jgi:hypothetical protein
MQNPASTVQHVDHRCTDWAIIMISLNGTIFVCPPACFISRCDIKPLCTTCFSTLKFCILPTQCICVFRIVLTINSINRLYFIAVMWCFLWGTNRIFIVYCMEEIQSLKIPCGGGVEYLYRSPANRRRRRKGKSRVWDSKIWSRVPRDSDPKMTARARTSSDCKRQTRPSSKRAPHINKSATVWLLYSKTDWPADRRS